MAVEYNLEFSHRGIWNFMNRTQRVRKRLRKELKVRRSDKILDIGCNEGKLVSYLGKFCRGCIGIDINSQVIERAKARNLKVMDARRMSFKDNYFDKIVSSMTIEHIEGLEAVFKEINRVLKPGGIVVLHYPWELFKGMGTLRNACIFLKNPFKGCKIHVNRLNHKEIERLCKGTELRIIKKGFFFDPQPGYITVLEKAIV